jgi:hypothetical protein
MDRDDDHIVDLFRRYHRAARRLRRVIRQGHVPGRPDPYALERAAARLAQATSEVFIALVLSGNDHFLDRVQLEQAWRTRASPSAAAAEIERGLN